MDSTYIFNKTKYHKAMVFHSRFQMDSFRVKKKNRSFLKKNRKNQNTKKPPGKVY